MPYNTPEVKYHKLSYLFENKENLKQTTIKLKLAFNDAALCRPDLHQRLCSISHIHFFCSIKFRTSFSIYELVEEFQNISAVSGLKAPEKLAVEAYKAFLMKIIHRRLGRTEESENKETSFNSPAASLSPLKKLFNWVKKNISQITRWTAFGVLIIVEFAPPLVGGLMYASQALAGLLPYVPFAVPGFALTALGILTVVSSLAGMICFVTPVLMEWLGITSFTNENKSLFQIYQEQLVLTEEINTALREDNDLESQDHEAFSHAANEFNKNMLALKQNTPESKQGIVSKIISIIMLGLTVLQSFSGSIFFSASTVAWGMGVKLATAAAITTFVASMPTLIFLVAIPFFLAALAMTYRLRNTSAINVLHPAGEQHMQLTKQLDNFNETKARQFRTIYWKKADRENALESKLKSQQAPVREKYEKCLAEISSAHRFRAVYWKKVDREKGHESKHAPVRKKRKKCLAAKTLSTIKVIPNSSNLIDKTPIKSLWSSLKPQLPGTRKELLKSKPKNDPEKIACRIL